ncbi:claudin-8-like [Trichomycterus rosablanca]|uniref:claudin-8-like n=1 Tax=Trichomycterus rosablanca TaxID=2290929 RepID=UPI002F3551B9
MVASGCELIGLCLGIVGLIGSSTVTGLPMWKVTAFIQENIIVMETRWEGLWMNCYRQANIRMQCKVYDSLLYLPAELQAARGLMCCSVALSFLALVASIPGLRSTSCLSDQPRVKSLIMVVAGSMQIMSALCVIIPVSWTAHSVIQDFYNPLLLDAQRRELGEALYIGWVTGFLLFCSGVVFLSCRDYKSNRHYQPVYAANSLTMPHHPSSFHSISHQPLLLNRNIPPQQLSSLAYNPTVVPPAGQPALYTVPVVYPANMMPVQYHLPETLSTPGTSIHSINSGPPSIHPSIHPAPPIPAHQGNSKHPTQLSSVMDGYNRMGSEAHSSISHSTTGVYI